MDTVLPLIDRDRANKHAWEGLIAAEEELHN